MNLRRLSYFVAVAEERHFGRAADRLFVAQPALSQQVKTLEAELGVELLDRSTRRVDLTPAGERLLVRAREILSAVEGATDEVRRVHRGEEGLLRLGFIGSATYELMPRLARALRADLPHLQVELRGELLSPDLLALLRDGRLDLGFLRPFAPVAGLLAQPLRSERLVAAVPADHPAAGASGVALATLASEDFVAYPRQGSAMGEALAAACLAAGFEPVVRAEVRETSALVSFVAAGLGVALVPEGVRHVRIPGVAYVPLSDVAQTVGLVAAWRADAPAAAVRHALERVSP